MLLFEHQHEAQPGARSITNGSKPLRVALLSLWLFSQRGPHRARRRALQIAARAAPLAVLARFAPPLHCAARLRPRRRRLQQRRRDWELVRKLPLDPQLARAVAPRRLALLPQPRRRVRRVC